MTLLPDEPFAILTDRQKTALERVTAEAGRHGLFGCQDHLWDFAFSPEVRPGRGRDVRIWYCDGEKVATATIDVYGSYRGPEIASVEWECAGGSEYIDLECAFCPDDEDDDDDDVQPVAARQTVSRIEDVKPSVEYL